MQFYFLIYFFVGYFVTYYSKDSFLTLLVLLIIATIYGSSIAPGFGIVVFVMMFIGFFVRKMIRHVKDNFKLFS